MASNVNAMTLPEESKKRKSIFSWPLFKQSFKANWVIWLALTLGMAAILVIINIVVGSRNIFISINMDAVSRYVNDEEMSWLQILGLLEKMGFSLSRIQVMSNIDMNSILNDITYKIAGTLLPIIYIILVCNKLVATQVDNGSLAYVLSTPTNRKKVVRTQYLFLILSLIAMYLVNTLFAIVSEFIGYQMRAMPLRTLLYNAGSFCVMVALSGICFFGSTVFNTSKNSLAFGGGICVVTFLCCILGLFGSEVFVSVGVGVSAMNVFNYISLITLFDTPSITTFSKHIMQTDPEAVLTFAWLWKMAILVGVGIIFAYIGGRRFVKKDLPL